MARMKLTSALMIAIAALPILTHAVTQKHGDARLAEILQEISKTTREGLSIIDGIQAMRPEVSDQMSIMTLSEIVEDYAFNKGAYNIHIIGWAASQKRVLPSETIARWKVVLFYKDWKKEYQAAEWEYNKETNRLYPFEQENAPGFWSNYVGPAKKRNK